MKNIKKENNPEKLLSENLFSKGYIAKEIKISKIDSTEKPKRLPNEMLTQYAQRLMLNGYPLDEIKKLLAEEGIGFPIISEVLDGFISDYKEKTGLSISELARKADIDQANLHKILDRKRNPERNTIIRIAMALELSFNDTQILLKSGNCSLLSPSRESDLIIMQTIIKNESCSSNDKITWEELDDLLGDTYSLQNKKRISSQKINDKQQIRDTIIFIAIVLGLSLEETQIFLKNSDCSLLEHSRKKDFIILKTMTNDTWENSQCNNVLKSLDENGVNIIPIINDDTTKSIQNTLLMIRDNFKLSDDETKLLWKFIKYFPDTFNEKKLANSIKSKIKLQIKK